MGKDHLVTRSQNNRLPEVLNGLQVRLEGELRGSRDAVTHPGARGEASEEDWLRVLKDHLPARYQADRAFVIDSKGACSDQIDIVIYDRQYSPLLYNQANQRFVPAESVYGILEAKQDLSAAYIRYAGKKAASVRRLHRTSSTIHHAAGSHKPRPLPRILAGIVAYKSSWRPVFGKPFQNALGVLGPEAELDLGCILRDGTFEVRYHKGQPPDVTIAEGSQSLVQFLIRLLKQLQGLATAPAIDYDAYLTGLGGKGPLGRKGQRKK